VTAILFSGNSRIPPIPCSVAHPGVASVGYTCHMAVMHWAQMTLGASQTQANEIVAVFTRVHCPGCKGAGPHGSVSPTAYGSHFCRIAKEIPSGAELHGKVAVGDVLITDHPSMPMHSMVVDEKRGADHITIRGFNNWGTLGTGQHSQYDPVSRNITKHWKNAADGKFGQNGVPLYVVKYDDFMRASQLLRQEVARTASLRR
jgi:hypothetical protein